MAVIDLRGPGSIPDSIRRLGGAVASVVSSVKFPNKEERKEFNEALRNNPALGERLAALDKRSPGFLDTNFGFLSEEVRESIRAIKPSAVQSAEAVTTEGFENLPEDVRKTLGQFGVTGVFGTTPSGAVLEPKRVEAARALPQEAVTAGLERDVRDLTPGGKAQDDFRLEVFNSATEAIGELGLDEKKAATLRSALPAAFFDEDSKLAHTRRLEIANLQIDAQNIDRANERLDSFQRGVAARWVNKTNVGLPETWQLFLYSKDANDRAKLLQSRTVSPENESDISLLEVADAFARAKDADKIIEQAAASRQIPILIERIERRDRDGKFFLERSVRVALVEQLNFTYMEASALSEGRLPFRKAEIPAAGRFFGKNKALRILDESGQEVEQSPERLEEIREQSTELNFETVDVSQLSENDRDNLISLINGEGTMEELLRDAPLSAQRILDARRNR